jgi:phage recombination protein Bet
MTTEMATREILSMEKIQSYLDAMNLATNLTKAESKQFIEIAMAYGLNPFKREIYATKYGTNFSIIVGFETYLKRAERSGLLSGWKVETDGTINKQNVADSDITATITIHRKDWNEPFIHTVYFSEYVQRRGDGQPNKFWKEKPITMIKKVAMAQGFRLCFSDENGGLPYTSEEIGTDQMMEAQIIQSNIREVPAEPKRIAAEPAKVETAIIAENKPGRGRPRKVVAEVSDEIKAKVMVCINLDDLKSVWLAHPELHNSSEFKIIVNDRKKILENMELVDKIRLSEDVDYIMSIVENSMDETVLKLAHEKINSLTTKTEADELF